MGSGGHGLREGKDSCEVKATKADSQANRGETGQRDKGSGV